MRRTIYMLSLLMAFLCTAPRTGIPSFSTDRIILFLSIAQSISIYLIYKRQKKKVKEKLIKIHHAYKIVLRDGILLQKQNLSLHQQLTYYQGEEEPPEKWNAEQALLTSNIVKQFQKYANKGQSPSGAEWESLDNTIRNTIPNFMNKIYEPQAQLTDKEICVCILLKLQFIPTEAAILLGLTKQRVTNMRRSINMKLFHTRGAKSLNRNLRRI